MRASVRVAAAVLLTSTLTTLGLAQPDVAHAAHTDRPDWLLVADAPAAVLSVVDEHTGARRDHLDGVRLGTHAGVIQLGHGHVAFVDEARRALDVLRITQSGRMRIVQSFAIPQVAGPWNRAGWISTDVTRRYIAVGSDVDDSTRQQVTLVDRTRNQAHTASITTHRVQLATTGKPGTEEMETFLVGHPLELVVTAGGVFDAYSARSVLAGDTAPGVIASTPLGQYPHGPIVDASGTTIGSTLHDGIETVRVDQHGFRPATTAPYPVPAAQSFRPRMAQDGTTAVGTQAGSSPTAPALLTSSSTVHPGVRTVRLQPGTVTRSVVTATWAAAVVTSAQGTDTLDVVDRAADGSFTGHVTRITVDRARTPTTGARFLAASADGTRLFLSRAEDTTVTVVRVQGHAATVVAHLSAGSAMSDGGYLATVDAGVRPFDLIGR
ncbi:hypothetical protein ACLBWP_14940 [Microbacterium sp. M1A1_1b]